MGKLDTNKNRKDSLLEDVFGENLQNAINNFCVEENEQFQSEQGWNSPALTSAVPPNHNKKDKNEIIEIEDDNDDVTIIEIEEKKEKSPDIEGIENISPIELDQNDQNDQNITIFCHRLVAKNKDKLISNLVNNFGIKKAKSLNKNVSHYVIDIELTDKTKEMRLCKERQKKGLLQIVNSKWLHLKLKELKLKNKDKQNKNDKKYEENSITRARKRKYKDCDYDDDQYFDEDEVNDEISGFDENDQEMLSAINKKQRKRTNKKRKMNEGDIRKHITMTNKIGVLLTGIGGKEKMKYEQIINDLNGVVLNDCDYSQNDQNKNKEKEVNFKYIVAAKLVRSEKIIIGII